ncbi:MAG: alkaline phosphatase [Verrucomicrobiales bacterium]
MKFRVRLLALLTLVLFVAMGVFYFRYWAIPRTQGVIVFVADGLSVSQLSAARMFRGGSDSSLQMEELTYLGLLRNGSDDYAVPDVAAAVSALATGNRVPNYWLSTTRAGRQLRTLVDQAYRKGRTVGLVTNMRVTDGGVAPFFANSERIRDFQSISLQLVNHAGVSLAFGGGRSDFLPEFKGGKRSDGRDLLVEFERQGQRVLRARSELEALASLGGDRVIGLFSDGPTSFREDLARAMNEPTLTDMTRKALEVLQQDGRPYLLIVHSGLIGLAAELNEPEKTIRETVEFDRAVGVARGMAERNSLVVVCGLRSVGGMSLNGYPFREESGAAIFGINSYGIPSIAWASGPRGPYGTETGTDQRPSTTNTLSSMSPAAAFSSRAVGTVEDVLVLADGPGASAIQSFLHLTDLHKIIAGQL